MSYIRNQSHNKISKLKFNNLAKLFPVGKDLIGECSFIMLFSIVEKKRFNSP